MSNAASSAWNLPGSRLPWLIPGSRELRTYTRHRPCPKHAIGLLTANGFMTNNDPTSVPGFMGTRLSVQSVPLLGRNPLSARDRQHAKSRSRHEVVKIVLSYRWSKLYTRSFAHILKSVNWANGRHLWPPFQLDRLFQLVEVDSTRIPRSSSISCCIPQHLEVPHEKPGHAIPSCLVALPALFGACQGCGMDSQR